MKVFKIVQRQYAILGIVSSSNQSTEKCFFSRRVYIGFLLFGCLIFSQFVYIFYVANSFMKYMEWICSSSSSIVMFVCFMATVLRKTTLFENIEKLEELIDARCKYPKAKKLFMKTIRKTERLTKITFVVVMKISLQLFLLPKFIVSFGVYFVTDSPGSESFQLPFPMWFPFDSDNPIGYLIAVIIEYIICGYEFYTVATSLAHGMGGLWFAVSIIKEIKRILNSINDKVKTNESQSNELIVLLSEFIDTHATLIQLENDTSDILQPIIMSIFTWSLLPMPVAMLMIQIEILHHGNVMPVLILILTGVFALVVVFLLCELGQGMTDAFEKIDFTIEKFDWYLLPIEIKRMLPMVISVTQQPVTLNCFGSTTCSRDVFKNIIHSAYSYFMVLCQLSN